MYTLTLAEAMQEKIERDVDLKTSKTYQRPPYYKKVNI